MLTKFPVTTDRGEYRVTIEENQYIDDMLNVRVYVRARRIPLLRFRSLGRCVKSKKRWHNDLVGLAKQCVIEKEQRYISRGLSAQAIEAFRNWDGDMTTKEESR